MAAPDPMGGQPVAGQLRAPASAGVIHDIGYRNYDGERLGRGYIARSLFVSSLRGVFGLGRSGKSKVLPMLLFVTMLLPALVIVAVINIVNLQEQPWAYSQYAVIMQAVIAIFVAAQSPQLVSHDLRFRTITLYLARPLERVDYVTAKYAARTAALMLLIGTPLLVLSLGGLLAGLPFGRQTAEFAAGVLGAIVLSLLLAGLGLVFAALTPRRGFAVALVIVVLLVSYGAVNLVAIVAWEEGNLDLAGWVYLFSPITLFDGVQSFVLNTPTSLIAPPPGTLGGIVFCLFAVACIAGAFAILLARYRRLAAA